MRIILYLLAYSSLLITYSQESAIKGFAEGNNSFKYCLYPSTLRMINISNDPNYNELVNDVDKLLIYKLDSATIISKSYISWINGQNENEGFEEYISVSGANDLILLGKEDEYIGIAGSNESIIAFYLRGNIALQKIPKLLETFKSGDILSIITDRLR